MRTSGLASLLRIQPVPPTLERHQKEVEAAARVRETRVTAPAGTNLVFEIGDRPVTRQDGDAFAAAAGTARNLIDHEVQIPAGAVRVTPMEESANGIIAFPDMQWDGNRVRGLKMQFRHGKIVAYTAATTRTPWNRTLPSIPGSGPGGGGIV